MNSLAAPQIKDWDGASGENWVVHQHRLDAMLEAFGDAAMLAAKVLPGDRVLDVGCGAGATSFALATHVGARGHVLGIDISTPLIMQAKADQPPHAPVEFQRADAAHATLAPGRFDLLFSRFGVMFFDDPIGAFTHMRTALKPNGRLAFACWRAAAENDWVRLPMEAIHAIAPPQPTDPTAPGPFSFADALRVEELLSAAGFVDIVVAPFDAIMPFGHGNTRAEAIDDAVAMAFAVGPLSRALAAETANARARAAAAVHAAFARRPGVNSIMLDGAAWIVTARNKAD